MQKLGPPDSHHLNAAIGWLGLNCVDDARLELAKISAAHQTHPDTLEVRWTLCAHEKRWVEALKIAELELQTAPNDSAGWLHRAYALRRVENGGLELAWTALLSAAEKFPAEPVITYNLACYACQLNQLAGARKWLQRAVKIGGKEAIQKMALADDDLKLLWPEIKAW